MSDLYTGDIYIVAAPSGGGKTSLVKELVTNLDNIAISISHTTRLPRIHEQEGVDYFFISKQQFIGMLNENAFVEHACVFNHYYGTSVTEINSYLTKGIDVVLDIDWQGAQQIRHSYPDATSIFILPPSLNVLKQRLQARGQDESQVISYRMRQAQDELSHFVEFDYVIVNDDFDTASMELRSIVVAKRLVLARQTKKMEKLLSLLLPSQ